MNLISWNLNGLKPILNNATDSQNEGDSGKLGNDSQTANSFSAFAGYTVKEYRELDPVVDLRPDIICCQATFARPRGLVSKGYRHYWNVSEREGIGGTLLLSQVRPAFVHYGFGTSSNDNEGRLICAEYHSFYLMNACFPEIRKEVRFLRYRQLWEAALLDYLIACMELKPVILCGDFPDGDHEDIQELFEVFETFGLVSACTAAIPPTVADFADCDSENDAGESEVDDRSSKVSRLGDPFFLSIELLPRVKGLRQLDSIGASLYHPRELVIDL